MALDLTTRGGANLYYDTAHTMLLRYWSARPTNWPVSASRIAPVSGFNYGSASAGAACPGAEQNDLRRIGIGCERYDLPVHVFYRNHGRPPHTLQVCRPLLPGPVEHNINYIQCSVCVPKPTEYATASGAAGVERLQWNHEEQRRMPHIG